MPLSRKSFLPWFLQGAKRQSFTVVAHASVAEIVFTLVFTRCEVGKLLFISSSIQASKSIFKTSSYNSNFCVCLFHVRERSFLRCLIFSLDIRTFPSLWQVEWTSLSASSCSWRALSRISQICCGFLKKHVGIIPMSVPVKGASDFILRSGKCDFHVGQEHWYVSLQRDIKQELNSSETRYN
jgi:hypothetical protein